MLISNVLVPLINPNEPEAKLIEIHIKNKQFIKQGDILFSLETTKATSEVEAVSSGYIQLVSEEGNLYSVGDLLAVITENMDDEIQPRFEHEKKESNDTIRITRPARQLADEMDLNINEFPKDKLITESVIREIVKNTIQPDLESIHINSEKSILIYAGGGHAKSLIDLVKSINKYEIIGIIDDLIQKDTIVMGIPVIGTRAILDKLEEKGLLFIANGVGGIVNISSRVKVFDLIEKYKFQVPILVHHNAWVENSAIIEKGVQVFANSYVGSEALLKAFCMVNTNAVVSHDCIIGSYSHIAPGALLAGHVEVGDKTLVGMGVKTAIGIKIGDRARIGNGAIINANVPSKSIVPAGKIWNG